MFLLIPLMSSPVVASFTQSLGGVWTVNWPPPPGAGPTAGGTIVGPPSPLPPDSLPYDICFSVEYNYADVNPTGTGSDHWIEIIGSYQMGGAGGWTAFSFSQTPITLLPSQSIGGTYTTSAITGYGGPGTNFNLNVLVSCKDLSTSFTFTWTSNAVTFTTT